MMVRWEWSVGECGIIDLDFIIPMQPETILLTTPGLIAVLRRGEVWGRVLCRQPTEAYAHGGLCPRRPMPTEAYAHQSTSCY